MSTTAPRTMIHRSESLTFNPRWVPADRALVLHHMDRLGVVACYRISSAAYVGCLNSDDEIVMWLHPGYIRWPDGTAPTNALDGEYGSWWPLTTSQARAGVK